MFPALGSLVALCLLENAAAVPTDVRDGRRRGWRQSSASFIESRWRRQDKNLFSTAITASAATFTKHSTISIVCSYKELKPSVPLDAGRESFIGGINEF